MTISELCAELNNYFERGEKSGEFEIIDGKLNVDFLLNNQYFRISGSIFNDGVHKFPDEKLTDEKFSGEILLMAIPPAVISLADDIGAWLENNKAALNSPYSSESFGGYSYTLAQSDTGSEATSSGVSWQAHFRSSLNKWRKV